MSILFKGNLEEGNYTLIKTTDGWVLKGKTSYVGFNFAGRPQGEWIVSDDKYFYTCQFCNADVDVSMGTGIFVNNDEVSHVNFCPNCGARMKGADDEAD